LQHSAAEFRKLAKTQLHLLFSLAQF